MNVNPAGSAGVSVYVRVVFASGSVASGKVTEVIAVPLVAEILLMVVPVANVGVSLTFVTLIVTVMVSVKLPSEAVTTTV